PKFASYYGSGVCEIWGQSGTRIIGFASVPLIPRFASSVPQGWTNLGIGTLRIKSPTAGIRTVDAIARLPAMYAPRRVYFMFDHTTFEDNLLISAKIAKKRLAAAVMLFGPFQTTEFKVGRT